MSEKHEFVERFVPSKNVCCVDIKTVNGRPIFCHQPREAEVHQIADYFDNGCVHGAERDECKICAPAESQQIPSEAPERIWICGGIQSDSNGPLYYFRRRGGFATVEYVRADSVNQSVYLELEERQRSFSDGVDAAKDAIRSERCGTGEEPQ